MTLHASDTDDAEPRARDEQDARSPAAAAPNGTKAQLEAEVTRLRSRVDALERELVEVQSSANAAVARWQERAYWLDRWHLDLNALMERPGAAEFRGLLRAIRSLARFFKSAKRRLPS